MDTRNNEQTNNENQNRRPYTGATNLFLTLLRKNRDEVNIRETSGQMITGVIDAFDEQGIVLRETIEGESCSEIYITRLQIITITPRSPVSYLNVL